MRTNQWYEDNKDLILELYYSPMKVEDICLKLGCGKCAIYKKFNEWGIKRREPIKKRERYNAIYNVDTGYFSEINTEHKAYWLGFIVADGHVNNKGFSIALKKSDEYMLEMLKKDLKSEHPIHYNKDNNPTLTITSKALADSLIRIGLHNRKSWELDFDKVVRNVPYELEHHFIRGIFDGDGCIAHYKYPYLKKEQIHFGITGVENTCNYIRNKFNIKAKLYFEGNKTFTVRTRNPKTIIDIFNYLYKDATIYLDRKYQKFKEIQMMTFNDYNKAIS